MGKSKQVLCILILFLCSSATTAIAGGRYYSSGYRSSYHSGSHVQYRHNYNNYGGNRGHYYRSNEFWAPLGVGFLAGAVVGAIAQQPERQRTIVYNNAPPVIMQTDPIIVRQQYIQPSPPPQLILKRVRTMAKLLNVRVGPGMHSNVTGQVQKGEILDVLGAAADWLYIKTKAGQYGWVMSQYTLEAEGPVG
jgi:uncharacterized protein YgiM (DUF1202 family)